MPATSEGYFSPHARLTGSLSSSRRARAHLVTGKWRVRGSTALLAAPVMPPQAAFLPTLPSFPSSQEVVGRFQGERSTKESRADASPRARAPGFSPAGLWGLGGHPRATHPGHPLPQEQAMREQMDADIGSWVILPPSSSSSAHIPPTDIPPHWFNTSTHPTSTPNAERQGSKQQQTGQPCAPYSGFTLQKKQNYFQLQPFL